MVISAPKFSECAKYEYTNVGAFFGWLLLHPKFQNAPKVNVLMLVHFWVVTSAPNFSECAQCECTNVGAFLGWLFLSPNFQNVPKVNVVMLAHFLGGYFCTQIFRICPRRMG